MSHTSPFEGSILLVAEPLNPGGIAVYTRSILSGLRQANIRHRLITSVRPSEGALLTEEQSNIDVVQGLFWSVWRPFIFRKLVAWAREHDPVIIHGLSALAAPICAQLSKALGIPFVVTVHHFQKPGALRSEEGCHAFIAVSESLRENLVNDARIPRELVRLIPGGISVPKELRARPAEYNRGEAVPLISSFGKLIPRKDYPTFLKAARLVIDRLGPQNSFVILGEGPDEPSLRKLARELKIDKQVTFCDTTAAVEPIFRDTDVYVQCSKQEGFGTMVLQAMAHGVPVVTTAAGGILSLVRDGETGFVVPIGDHEALAGRICNLLTDPTLAARIGDAARQMAVENYDLDAMMSSTLALYSEAVSEDMKITKT